MSDIIEDLRYSAQVLREMHQEGPDSDAAMCYRAADEIERLRVYARLLMRAADPLRIIAQGITPTEEWRKEALAEWAKVASSHSQDVAATFGATCSPAAQSAIKAHTAAASLAEVSPQQIYSADAAACREAVAIPADWLKPCAVVPCTPENVSLLLKALAASQNNVRLGCSLLEASLKRETSALERAMNAPDYLHHIIGETVNVENDTAQKGNHWAVILGLVPVRDGDHYGIVWGDLPTGVSAFGKTPVAAIMAFDVAMYESASPTKDRDE